MMNCHSELLEDWGSFKRSLRHFTAFFFFDDLQRKRLWLVVANLLVFICIHRQNVGDYSLANVTKSKKWSYFPRTCWVSKFSDSVHRWFFDQELTRADEVAENLKLLSKKWTLFELSAMTVSLSSIRTPWRRWIYCRMFSERMSMSFKKKKDNCCFTEDGIKSYAILKAGCAFLVQIGPLQTGTVESAW